MMILSVDGNIGSGKSTLVKELGNYFQHVVFIQEPVEIWQKVNLLDLYYQNKTRWAYTFQMNAFITRAKIIQENIDKDFIMERSIYSDKYCFAINCYENKLLNEIEWKLYNQWHDWLSKSMSLEGDAYIYLRTTPEIAYDRIQKRNRKEESNISLEYIKQIHNKHEEWLYKRADNILVMDGNIENTSKRLENFKEQIKSFIKKLRLNKLNQEKQNVI